MFMVQRYFPGNKYGVRDEFSGNIFTWHINVQPDIPLLAHLKLSSQNHFLENILSKISFSNKKNLKIFIRIRKIWALPNEFKWFFLLKITRNGIFFSEFSLRRTNSKKVIQGSADLLSNDPSFCFRDKHKIVVINGLKTGFNGSQLFYIYQEQIIWRTWPYASQKIESFVKNRKFRQLGIFKYLTSIW